jgi:hypothetical protein
MLDMRCGDRGVVANSHRPGRVTLISLGLMHRSLAHQYEDLELDPGQNFTTLYNRGEENGTLVCKMSIIIKSGFGSNRER